MRNIYIQSFKIIFLGFNWQKELLTIEQGGTVIGGTQGSFKIHIANDADQAIIFRQSAPAIGPVVDVPKDVTATVDYVDKDKLGQLTFEAVGQDSKTGAEIKYMLNDKWVFTVDEQNVPIEGEFVVVHREGQEWELLLKKMKDKKMGGSIITGGSTTTTGGTNINGNFFTVFNNATIKVSVKVKGTDKAFDILANGMVNIPVNTLPTQAQYTLYLEPKSLDGKDLLINGEIEAYFSAESNKIGPFVIQRTG